MTTTTRRRTPKPVVSDADLNERVEQLHDAMAELVRLLAQMTPAERQARADAFGNRLKSRKFLLAVLAGAIVAGADVFGYKLNSETVLGILGVVIAYITGNVAQKATAGK